MNCQRCSRDFIPHQGGQRFCCRACSDAWYQEERRQAVEWFRTKGMTVQREDDERGTAA
jgi:hypothetical protein